MRVLRFLVTAKETGVPRGRSMAWRCTAVEMDRECSLRTAP